MLLVQTVFALERTRGRSYSDVSPLVVETTQHRCLPRPPILSSTEGESMAVVVAPMLKNMPELRELCMSLSVENMKIGSSATSCEEHDLSLSCVHLKNVDACGVLAPAFESRFVTDRSTSGKTDGCLVKVKSKRNKRKKCDGKEKAYVIS